MDKKVCIRCNKIKDKDGFIISGWYKSNEPLIGNICKECRSDPNYKSAVWKRVKSKYEEMIERRSRSGLNELQDRMWKELEWLGLEDDSMSFTDSEEMDNIVKRYEEALILKLSGIEEIPTWLDPEGTLDGEESD